MDHVIKKALSRMPDNCKVHIHVLGRNRTAGHSAAAEHCSIERMHCDADVC
jgi:hypothetical protein